MKIKKITLINIVILLTLILVGCDSATDFIADTLFAPIFIVGKWDVTEIEGSGISVDSSNSMWVFETDNTYEWFLLVGSFELQSQGNYSMNGNQLMVDGTVTKVFGTDRFNLTFSNSYNTFSLQVDDGDRWTYNRRVE